MTAVDPQDIGIIILAAGSSRRWGGDKRRAVLGDGRTLLEATLEGVPESFTRRVLVLKREDADLAGRFSATWQVCHAQNPAAGMANSLASGIARARDWQGALIGMGDMPFISPATYSALQQALTTHDIVIPCVNGKRGNPAGFRRRYFGEIEKLEGDRGAKSLLRKYAGECREVETGDAGILRDIDTPDGLA